MWTNQQFSGDWALNPSAYKNVSHEDVDWASLAQEWIKMKEVSSTTVTPQPQHISSVRSEKNEDKGEAPMDMDTDDKGPDAPSDNPIEVAAPWETWPGWQPQWGWNWPAGAQPVSGVANKGPPPKAPFGFPTGYNSGDSAPTIDYNHGGSTTHQPVFWTGQTEGSDIPDKEPQMPKAFLRNRYTWKRDRDRDRKDHARENGPIERSEDDSMETLDAAKRKQLPAWIREGLEKMEREKQRKMDKERMDREREEQLRIQKEAEEEMLSKMSSTEAAKLLAKSKFDSDGSDEETVQDREPSPKTRKSRFHTVPEPSVKIQPARKEARSPSPPSGPPKSREEILEDVMMKVRRTLTEILLDVTSSEIAAIARDVYHKARSQAPAKRLGKSQAITSITAKSGLGLGIYGSDDESQSEDESQAPNRDQQGYNSDQELEQVIERKKEKFAETEKVIEAQLQAEEDRELGKEKEAVSVSSDGESNDGVGQVDRKCEKSKSSPHSHGTKKELPDRENERSRHKRRFSEHSRSNVVNEDKTRNRRAYSNSDSSSSSRSPSRQKTKRRRKRSSSDGTSSSEESSDCEKSKRKQHHAKRKVDSDSDGESKKKSRQPEVDKRHKKKDKKSERARKKDEEKSKRSRRSRSRSASKESSSHRRRRSRSRDSRDRRRRRSRSRESDARRRRSRSRSRDSDYRRRRSRSRESTRKHTSKSSRTRRDSDEPKRRRRERSSSS